MVEVDGYTGMFQMYTIGHHICNNHLQDLLSNVFKAGNKTPGFPLHLSLHDGIVVTKLSHEHNSLYG